MYRTKCSNIPEGSPELVRGLRLNPSPEILKYFIKKHKKKAASILRSWYNNLICILETKLMKQVITYPYHRFVETFCVPVFF